MGFSDEIYRACRKIPRGRVTTYKELARAINTRAYRAVGQALKHNPFAPGVPCHRVVSSNGCIGGFRGKIKGKDIDDKIRMLSKEGITIREGKIVDFERVFFKVG